MIDVAAVRRRYEAVSPVLDERGEQHQPPTVCSAWSPRRWPGGAVEILNLWPMPNDHHAFQSALAPAEPHEFNATLYLSSGSEKESLSFHMTEPNEHHH